MESPPDARPEPDKARLVEVFDRILALDPAQAEFRFLRDAVSGTRVDAPPDGYVAGFFDRFAAQFDERVAGRLKYQAPGLAREMLAGWLAQRGRVAVLDLGCGTGLSGQAVRDHASRLAGVDLSQGMLDRARELGAYDSLSCSDIVGFLQQPQQWDLVMALDVFIYVGALEAAFEGISRAMAPGARFVFSVESMAGAGSRCRRPAVMRIQRNTWSGSPSARGSCSSRDAPSPCARKRAARCRP
jgi:predicted TPR repeat methyltransferase